MDNHWRATPLTPSVTIFESGFFGMLLQRTGGVDQALGEMSPALMRRGFELNTLKNLKTLIDQQTQSLCAADIDSDYRPFHAPPVRISGDFWP